MLRDGVRENTSLGKQAKEYMEKGELVPDEVMVGLVKNRLNREDCLKKGFILDGFPRTVPQAERLDDYLGRMNLGLDGVVSIDVSKEEIVRRLSQRAVCEECGTVVTATKDIQEGAGCRCCGGRLVRRRDDEPETIRHRLEVYERQTRSLIRYYEDRTLLRVVDGLGTLDDVYARIPLDIGPFAGETMISIKNREEISKLRRSAQLLVAVFRAVEEVLGPDVSTQKLDRIAEEVIRFGGGKPAFKGYKGYPASICSSVENQVVHGIPGSRRLREGEIVSIDIGVELDGYYSDAAKTYGIEEVSPEKALLMDTTRRALHRGIRKCRRGNHLSDISHAIQTFVESKGFSVVRALVGHGIGRSLHEEPQIPNFGPPHQGPKLRSGMVFAVEPMINMGLHEVKFLEDGWTVETSDGSPSAHFEHTVLVTEEKPEILTLGIEKTLA